MEAPQRTAQFIPPFHLPHMVLLFFRLLVSPLSSWHQYLAAGSTPGSLQNMSITTALEICCHFSKMPFSWDRACPGINFLCPTVSWSMLGHSHYDICGSSTSGRLISSSRGWPLAAPCPCNKDLQCPNKQMGYEGPKSADSVFRSIQYWLMQTSAITRAPENPLLHLHKQGQDCKACLMVHQE